MGTCSAKLTKYPFPAAKVAELLSCKGGQVTLSTTPYATEPATMGPRYWRDHPPGGNPGDKVYGLEDVRIDRGCQSATGYAITVKFEDGGKIVSKSSSPMAITAKDTFLSSTGAVPDIAIRLKMIIQDIQVVGDDWVFTMVLENAEETTENE